MRSRRTWTALAAVLILAGASACSQAAGTAGGPTSAGTSPSATGTPVSAAQISSTIAAGSVGVKVNRSLRLDVVNGTFTSVSVLSKGAEVAGTMSADKASWQSTARLLPGQTYRVSSVAVDSSGKQQTYQSQFRTQALALNQQTFPSFFPLPGSTVGVGMPVVIRFDVPVTDHESIQKHLTVTTVPAQVGAFHWISNTEVHWRPQKFWKPGTKVTVNADIKSVPAGGGVFGQTSRTSTFTIGRSMISKVDTRTDQLKVYRNGTLIRTIPITTGKQPDFTTRSGIKVIVEKHRTIDMNSGTIGIDPGSPQGYNLKNVEFAMRLTYSGEFLHAAPWSVASQGHANVSHGCTGMSTANAGWLFANSIIGDVVEYTGTSRPMTLTNGLGDWNLPFAQYGQGSTL
ncbi:MAG: ErfK/YbiS/YcfS/YnhG family protein [Marmoricola sp.]|nr:ErfK/YbiS/YcfS/YnhG family protein [Marmoricola sp.]